MSACVLRSSLTPEHIAQIRAELSFQAKLPFSRFTQHAVNPTICFYKADGDKVHLPYLFASALLQYIPNIDNEFAEIEVKFTGNLREEQVPIELEAWQQLENFGTTTIGLYPGFGKTIVGSSLTCRTQLLTCILIHRVILGPQWKHTYETNTTASVWIVGEKHPPEQVDVIICMYTRWSSIPEEVRNSVGFLIVDEAHLFCTPGKVECLLSFHPKYIAIETATLERDDELHHMIYAVAGSHGIYRRSTKAFKVFKIETNFKPIKKKNKQGVTDWPLLVKETLFNSRRNRIIVQQVIHNPRSTILILTSLVEHADLLYEKLTELGVDCDYMHGLKNTFRPCSVLIGTVSKISTGFDATTACPGNKPFDLVMLVCSFKKYSMIEQSVGRAFRCDYPIVFHFVDDDTIYKAHWSKANSWYKSRGGKIEVVEIPLEINLGESTSVSADWARDCIDDLRRKMNMASVK
jgi:hypothetical protein